MELVLRHSRQIELHPTAPFHFDGTLHKPSYFPSADNAWQPGTAWWTLRLGEQAIGLRLKDAVSDSAFWQSQRREYPAPSARRATGRPSRLRRDGSQQGREDAGCRDAPHLNLTVYSQRPLADSTLAAVADEVAYDLDLGLDLTEFNRLLHRDPLMRPVLRRWRGSRVLTSPMYESLVIYVVLQNATVRRTIQMMDNLLRAYGTLLHFDGRSLYAFWPPRVLDAAPEEDLRALKVGYRAKALKRISQPFARGEIDPLALRRLPTPELKREALKLYGIGPASVWYLLFEAFHRYDAFEYISPWEQKIFSRLLFDRELVPGEEILAEADRRWGRWKMLAAHYLFEDLFWRHARTPIPWLAALIRR
jgi:3-methyladenine DNA glycosylase/8-oxoguanine DNA glycosylase